MTGVARLGVLERGEVAVRVLNAVGELNHAGDGPPITTVLFHHDDGAAALVRPRGRRGTGHCHPGAEASEDVVAALQRAHIDTVWLGEWSHGRASDLIAACEAAASPWSARTRPPFAGSPNRATWGTRQRREARRQVADAAGRGRRPRRPSWPCLGARGRDVSVRERRNAVVRRSPVRGHRRRVGRAHSRRRTRIRALASDTSAPALIDIVHDGRASSSRASTPSLPPFTRRPRSAAGSASSAGGCASSAAKRFRGRAGGEGIAVEAQGRSPTDADDALGVSSGRVALLSFPAAPACASTRPPGGRHGRCVGSACSPSSPRGGPIAGALGRVRRALERTAVVIEDGASQPHTAAQLLAQATSCVRGDSTTAGSIVSSRERVPTPPVAVVLLAAAAEATKPTGCSPKPRSMRPRSAAGPSNRQTSAPASNSATAASAIGSRSTASTRNYSDSHNGTTRRHHRRRPRRIRAEDHLRRPQSSAARRSHRQRHFASRSKAAPTGRSRGRHRAARRPAGAGRGAILTHRGARSPPATRSPCSSR